MKYIILLMTVISMVSCESARGIDDCSRMVECRLVNCSGDIFSTIEVQACDARGLLNGCCPALQEVTCECPGL